MSLVLIVEDEPVLRSSVARGISKLPDVEVLTAGTVEDAVRIIDVSPPTVVVSDLDLPDGSGVELLSELDKRHVRAPVLFVSAYVGTFRSRIPRRANVEVYEKPVPIERLRQLVRDHVGGARSEVGDDDAPFSLDEYLQLACMGRHSVMLRAEIGGRRIGEIVVWAGDVRSAIDALGSGPDAFRRIATAMMGHASAHLSVRSMRAEPGARDMKDAGWQALLFDAARELDERRARGDHAPPEPREIARRDSATDLSAPVLSATAARSFDRLYEQAVDALLAKQFEEALAAFIAAQSLRPDDARVLTNVRRLKEMGYGRES